MGGKGKDLLEGKGAMKQSMSTTTDIEGEKKEREEREERERVKIALGVFH